MDSPVLPNSGDLLGSPVWRAIESPAASRRLKKPTPGFTVCDRGLPLFDTAEATRIIAEKEHEIVELSQIGTPNAKGSFETSTALHRPTESTQKCVRTPPLVISRQKYEVEEDYNDRLVDQYMNQWREEVSDGNDRVDKSYSTEEEGETELSSDEESEVDMSRTNRGPLDSSQTLGLIKPVPRVKYFHPISKRSAALNFPPINTVENDDEVGESSVDSLSVVAHVNTTLIGHDNDAEMASFPSARIQSAGHPRPKKLSIESDSSEHGAYTTSEDVSMGYSYERKSESTIKTSPGSGTSTRRSSASTGVVLGAGEERGEGFNGKYSHHSVIFVQQGSKPDTTGPTLFAVPTAARNLLRDSTQRLSLSLEDVRRSPENMMGSHAETLSPLTRSEHGTPSRRQRGRRLLGKSRRPRGEVDDSTPLVGEIEL